MNSHIHDYFTTIGKRGGRKTAQRGVQYYRNLQRRSVIKRRQNAAREAKRLSRHQAKQKATTLSVV